MGSTGVIVVEPRRLPKRVRLDEPVGLLQQQAGAIEVNRRIRVVWKIDPHEQERARALSPTRLARRVGENVGSARARVFRHPQLLIKSLGMGALTEVVDLVSNFHADDRISWGRRHRTAPVDISDAPHGIGCFPWL